MRPLYHHFDLITPDGKITAISGNKATVTIEKIAPNFKGFTIDPSLVSFNLKSTLAQLGIETTLLNLELSKELQTARIELKLLSTGPLGKKMLPLLTTGCYIGRLFAADDRRRVREPVYLGRMFGRADRDGSPLLTLGNGPGEDDLILEKIDGRTVAFLPLIPGTCHYLPSIDTLLPSIALALKINRFNLREMIRLHQTFLKDKPKIVTPEQLLLVKTKPLHVRTVFARVDNTLLPPGVKHTAANILEPSTLASGDIYELYGESTQEITDIPLEFYTLEPYREHVFFSDRDQLQNCLEDPAALFKAFSTAPPPTHHKCATFVVKSDQLKNLSSNDWIACESDQNEFPGIFHPERQALMVERYIDKQPSYPFLKAMIKGAITSQGVLLTRYFPSPVMKRILLSPLVQRCLKGIYFQYPSRSSGEFFSQEDRGHLLDLAKFGIPVHWVDPRTQKILRYVPKGNKDAGMFVPPESASTFSAATVIGIYGSNLIEIDLDAELQVLFQGLLDMRAKVDHPLLNKNTQLALVTGGGPGAMLVGNKAAKNLGLLSCANIVDFSLESGAAVHEQEQNPYIEAKMTYRLERLVERQAEFNLDLPIILLGGIGTDFELALEEVRRKVGVIDATPIILFGSPDYWTDKITSRFKRNILEGTTRGSEWVSNTFYCVQTAQEALNIYHKFFTGNLPIGKDGPIYKDGFHKP